MSAAKTAEPFHVVMMTLNEHNESSSHLLSDGSTKKFEQVAEAKEICDKARRAYGPKAIIDIYTLIKRD